MGTAPKETPGACAPGVHAFFRLSLFGDDRLRRTNACAGAAVDALVGIDYIDVPLRDSLYRAFADAGAAGNAGISDFVSHF